MDEIFLASFVNHLEKIAQDKEAVSQGWVAPRLMRGLKQKYPVEATTKLLKKIPMPTPRMSKELYTEADRRRLTPHQWKGLRKRVERGLGL